MQFTTLNILSLLVFASVIISNLEATDMKTRINRAKERADIKKDKVKNNLREKKLDAQEKIDEAKDKAHNYYEEKKDQAKRWKRRNERKARHNWNKALEKAKVKENV